MARQHHFSGSRRPSRNVVALCAGIVLCALIAAPLDAEDHPSTRTLKKMSQRQLDARARDDLLSILEPGAELFPRNYLELHGIRMNTRSSGTEFDGVCRRDTVTLRYTGAVPGEASEKKPVRPYSIEAQPTFHIVHLPNIEKEMGSRDPSRIAQPACMDVDKAWRKQALAEGRELEEWDAATWVEAKDALQAVQAGFMLDRALAAVRAHTLTPEPCSEFDRLEGQSCEQTILAVGGVSDMASIESCPAKEGLICYEIDFPEGEKLTIVARGEAEDPAPTSIQSIAVAVYITVS